MAAPLLRPEIFQYRVDSLFIHWLKNPIAYGAIVTNINNQRFSYFQRLVNLIRNRKLDTKTDREALERFLTWVNLWDTDRKKDICRSLDYLKRTYPDTDLWEIIKIESE
ncbi:MAG: hypothetical protein NT070_15700 [Cyanobacteria bacterium]|nr:hypothetical protein [Cyanobacteriota bacterium]